MDTAPAAAQENHKWQKNGSSLSLMPICIKGAEEPFLNLMGILMQWHTQLKMSQSSGHLTH